MIARQFNFHHKNRCHRTRLHSVTLLVYTQENNDHSSHQVHHRFRSNDFRAMDFIARVHVALIVGSCVCKASKISPRGYVPMYFVGLIAILASYKCFTLQSLWRHFVQHLTATKFSYQFDYNLESALFCRLRIENVAGFA